MIPTELSDIVITRASFPTPSTEDCFYWPQERQWVPERLLKKLKPGERKQLLGAKAMVQKASSGANFLSSPLSVSVPCGCLLFVPACPFRTFLASAVLFVLMPRSCPRHPWLRALFIPALLFCSRTSLCVSTLYMLLADRSLPLNYGTSPQVCGSNPYASVSSFCASSQY